MPGQETETNNLEVPDASATQAELEARIDAELGLEPEPNEPEPTTDTEDAPDTTTTDDSPEGEKPEETGDDASEEVEEAPSEPATPSDEELFIEVEDANGVTHKISQIEDLPEDFEPKSNRQGLEILRDLAKLETQAEQRQAEAETAQQKADIAEAQQKQLASWDKEVAELSKQKRIDVKDTERIDKVFDFMNKVNTSRAEAGNPNRLNSFEDALDKFEIQEGKDKAEADNQNGTAIAKAKSSLIGTSSASGKSDYVYVAGSARSIDDVPL